MGIFGWSLPPGVSTLPGDETEYCAVCGKNAEDECECPECPICHEIGNKECYGEPFSEADKVTLKSLKDDKTRKYNVWFDLCIHKEHDARREAFLAATKILEEAEAALDSFCRMKGSHGMVLSQTQIESAATVMAEQEEANRMENKFFDRLSSSEEL